MDSFSRLIHVLSGGIGRFNKPDSAQSNKWIKKKATRTFILSYRGDIFKVEQGILLLPYLEHQAQRHERCDISAVPYPRAFYSHGTYINQHKPLNFRNIIFFTATIWEFWPLLPALRLQHFCADRVRQSDRRRWAPCLPAGYARRGACFHHITTSISPGIVALHWQRGIILRIHIRLIVIRVPRSAAIMQYGLQK